MSIKTISSFSAIDMSATNNHRVRDALLGAAFLLLVLRFLAQLDVAYHWLANDMATTVTTLGCVSVLMVVLIGQITKSGRIPVILVWSFALVGYAATLGMLRQRLDATNLFFYFLPGALVVSLRSIDLKASRPLITAWLWLTFSVFAVQVAIEMAVAGAGFFIERVNRYELGSVFGHANSFTLVLGAMAIYAFVTKCGTRKFTMVAILLALSVISGGRTTLLGATLMLGGLQLSRTFGIRWRYANLAPFCFLALALFAYTQHVMSEGWGEQSIMSGNSLLWRVHNWSYYVDNFRSYGDWLLGFGPGAHEHVTDEIYGRTFEVHNDWLRLIYDLGILGALLYLIVDRFAFRLIERRAVGASYKDGIRSIYLVKLLYMFFDNFVGSFTLLFSIYFIAFFLAEKSRTKPNATERNHVEHSYSRKYRVGLS